MKILEEGNWKNPWSKEYVCSQKQCGAKLLVEEQDVIAPDYRETFNFMCPLCGNTNIIANSDLPQRIKSALERKRRPPSYAPGWRD
jgi:predicted RNA-binding Zn-ribbon protein involved in translation (DUF1610 family)